MDIVTLDFETYYDTDYSLSKMTTEEYVRDSRFEIIGVGRQVNGGKQDWYDGRDIQGFINQVDYSDKAILAHNTAFDGSILSWHLGIRPKMWLDTLSMARPWHKVRTGLSLKKLAEHYELGDKGDEVVRAIGKRRSDFTPQEIAAYGTYCKQDINLTYKLFQKLKRNYNTKELMLIDQTMRMFTEPELVLDTELLERHLVELRDHKTSLVDQMGLSCTEDEAKTILMSNIKFSKYLESLGVDVPMKISKATGLVAPAFAKSDPGMKGLLRHEDDRVVSAVEARLGVKSTIGETRTKRFIDISYRGTLPVMLAYYAAHTGRFGGADKINMQNLPRGGTLRRSIKAPPGKKLVACDSSQIEARIVAWLAGQHTLLQAFREERDVYREFASTLYNKTMEQISDTERFVGKTCILGLGYSMGPERLKDQLAAGMGGMHVKINSQEANTAVHLYRASNHNIASLWYRCTDVLRHMITGGSGSLGKLDYSGNTIKLPNGFLIQYPCLTSTPTGMVYANDIGQYRRLTKARITGVSATEAGTYIYGGKVVENITQACARIVVAYQGLEIGKRYKVVLQVHDEIVICVDEDEAEDAAAFMEEIMSQPPDWAPDLPVACESKIGDNYGECK